MVIANALLDTKRWILWRRLVFDLISLKRIAAQNTRGIAHTTVQQ